MIPLKKKIEALL